MVCMILIDYFDSVDSVDMFTIIAHEITNTNQLLQRFILRDCV